ncbi:aminomethyltransferase [Azospirillum fermentarium]|uniref:aminomethyltransferase family protein n=1 Tax=Azospirillum fermentarium TaxID=1233114 RepID=UPI002227A627|nr:aminomethyltransferase family protein [Azospirillum fermentarium]MCW2247718.1 aminomethyltransferase [Azospirillum fermentarium]
MTGHPLHTALHGEHVRLGARFTGYFGWQVPAVYTTEAAETGRLRHAAGVAEYGFMSHTLVCGRDALATLQHALTVDVAAQLPGRTFQALALAPEGTAIEEVTVHRVSEGRFIVSGRGRFAFHDSDGDCLLSARNGKPWLTDAAAGRVACVHPLGVQLLSVQGPASPAVLAQGADVAGMAFGDCRQLHLDGIPALVSRSGYSGEVGFDILVWPEYAVALWRRLEHWGRTHGMAPCGVNILTPISLEKGFLAGRDFYPGATPLELGLTALVAMDTDFQGRAALERRLAAGAETRLVGLELAGPVAAVPGTPIRAGTAAVGTVTASARSLALGRTLARGWVAAGRAVPGTRLTVQTPGGSDTALVAADYRWDDPADSRRRAALPLSPSLSTPTPAPLQEMPG